MSVSLLHLVIISLMVAGVALLWVQPPRKTPNRPFFFLMSAGLFLISSSIALIIAEQSGMLSAMIR